MTGGGATADRWAPEDETLMAEIPSELEVLRLPAADEPEGSSRWRGRAERWLCLRRALGAVVDRRQHRPRRARPPATST